MSDELKSKIADVKTMHHDMFACIPVVTPVGKYEEFITKCESLVEMVKEEEHVQHEKAVDIVMMLICQRS